MALSGIIEAVGLGSQFSLKQFLQTRKQQTLPVFSRLPDGHGRATSG